MTASVSNTVQKTITVEASVARAFEVFTSGVDTWWPRTHHIGKSPMTKNIIECHEGGRCYSTQENGSECDWGRVTAWEPPHRFVMAWQITHEWGYEPDIAKASAVEVRFTDAGGGMTRVDLEHRDFDKMGPGGETVRIAVSSSGGWGALLELFAASIPQPVV